MVIWYIMTGEKETFFSMRMTWAGSGKKGLIALFAEGLWIADVAMIVVAAD